MIKTLTPRMVRIEERFQKDIRTIITECTIRYGMKGAAQKMGISTASLGNYINRLGMRMEGVVLQKGDVVEIKKHRTRQFKIVDRRGTTTGDRYSEETNHILDSE